MFLNSSIEHFQDGFRPIASNRLNLIITDFNYALIIIYFIVGFSKFAWQNAKFGAY